MRNTAKTLASLLDTVCELYGWNTDPTKGRYVRIDLHSAGDGVIWYRVITIDPEDYRRSNLFGETAYNAAEFQAFLRGLMAAKDNAERFNPPKV